MRIGIDARLFGPRTGGGGLGRYVEQLIRHLEIIDHKNEYVIFLRKENWNDYQPAHSNFKKVLADWRWYTIAEQRHMPRVIHEAKLDLIHYPHFNVPVLAKTPFVVTIHDLNLLQYPKEGVTKLDPVRFWLKYAGYRLVLGHAIKKARAIITVSEATRKAIALHFKISAKMIAAISPGFEIQDKYPDVSIMKIPPAPYLLAVGNAYPHKNLSGLLRGFQEILKDIPNLTLVLAGPDDRFRDRLKQQATDLGVSERVIFPGFVSDSGLNALYQNAAAYIMPSFLEGFGFPGLEAQARQCPVLASNIPVLRETLADGARYFDPRDPRSIAQAICAGVNNHLVRERIIKAGLENIKRFDWSRAAHITLQLYRTGFKTASPHP